MDRQFTPALGRHVLLRPGTSDRQVWADTFTGLYHVPPADMPKPETVLDLGANIGLTAAHYSEMWPFAAVVAVEMDEACADLAEMNAPDTTVRRHAVSGEGGWGTYDPAVRAEAYAFTRRIGQDPEAAEGRRVHSHTLQQVILREFGEGGVDFVKMDVEGEEWALFEVGDTWAPLVRHLLVELHGAGGSPALLVGAITALERLGLRACHLLPHPQAVYAWR
jgi:FkbM family methyltransferase